MMLLYMAFMFYKINLKKQTFFWITIYIVFIRISGSDTINRFLKLFYFFIGSFFVHGS